MCVLRNFCLKFFDVIVRTSMALFIQFDEIFI